MYGTDARIKAPLHSIKDITEHVNASKLDPFAKAEYPQKDNPPFTKPRT